MLTRRQILARALGTGAALGLGLALPGALKAGADQAVAGMEILPGWRMRQGRHMAALRVTMAPGWKTYWRSPGDAGIPAHFDWSGSDNLAGVALHWPVPRVFEQNGMTTVGYAEQLTLPLELTPRRADRPIDLSGSVEMGVCRDICMPVTLGFAATLPVGTTREDARIAAALADRPMSRAEAGVRALDCALTPRDRGIRVTASVTMPDLGGGEFAIFELPGAPVWISEAKAHRNGAVLTASADLIPERGKALAVNRSDLRLTILGARGAVDIRGCL